VQVKKMLDKGDIRESNSPCSSPAVLVPKKSLHERTKFRYFIDFGALTHRVECSETETYTLPVFEETAPTLYGPKFFYSP